MAIGQEIAVTPVQLVTMVSALANGGVYIPPRILLQSTDEMKGDARLQPAVFHPVNQLPATLPEGSHRVVSELTSAKMRMMMQGIVLEGTGRLAKLNGYSSAGKTGTAQKIDVATHTYSHTKLVASFAGFAPVSNPAIAIAVVIDTPTAGGEVSHYGGATSAPVFAEVAQQVLEYLGVPHDQPLTAKKDMKAPVMIAEGPSEPVSAPGDLQAMFDEVNTLPADDPLRVAAEATPVAAVGPPTLRASVAPVRERVMRMLPKAVLERFWASGGTNSTMPDALVGANAPLRAPEVRPQVQTLGRNAVMVDQTKRVAVPSFDGAGLRTVVEQAGHSGLRVEPVGSGLAREQIPLAGTMVPIGTEVVVRFTR